MGQMNAFATEEMERVAGEVGVFLRNVRKAAKDTGTTKNTTGEGGVKHSIQFTKDMSWEEQINRALYKDGIKNAPIVIENPDRNAIVYVTNVKQGGFPIVVAFDKNSMFDGDNVHKATSIHLQIDVQTMLGNL